MIQIIWKLLAFILGVGGMIFVLLFAMERSCGEFRSYSWCRAYSSRRMVSCDFLGPSDSQDSWRGQYPLGQSSLVHRTLAYLRRTAGTLFRCRRVSWMAREMVPDYRKFYGRNERVTTPRSERVCSDDCRVSPYRDHLRPHCVHRVFCGQIH